jgi:hypothetical protein
MVDAPAKVARRASIPSSQTPGRTRGDNSFLGLVNLFEVQWE